MCTDCLVFGLLWHCWVLHIFGTCVFFHWRFPSSVGKFWWAQLLIKILLWRLIRFLRGDFFHIRMFGFNTESNFAKDNTSFDHLLLDEILQVSICEGQSVFLEIVTLQIQHGLGLVVYCESCWLLAFNPNTCD